MGVALNGWWKHPQFWWIVYLMLAVIAAAQAFLTTDPNGDFTAYNNFEIFTSSFHHLLTGQNLYAAYPKEHWDLFKYSPTFALFMAPLAIVGPGLGLVLWNILNVALPLSALQCLPRLSVQGRVLILAFVAIEMMTSLQNEQSNGLVAGLLLWSFVHLENKRWWWAGAMLALCSFTKILGLAALVVLIFYPGKWKTLASFVVCGVCLFLLPISVTGWEGLIDQYTYWVELLHNDHSVPNTYSVMSVVPTWLGIDLSGKVIQLIGVCSMVVVGMLFMRFHREKDRQLLFSALLIWVVLFNHKAESPTFVIAAFGIGLWFVNSRRRSMESALVLFAFLFTVLAATDIFPRWLRQGFFETHGMKAVPCLLVWCWIMSQLVSSWWTQFTSLRE